ncbi:N-acetyltransferase [Devosia algicola]|uniref:N-acetyltransferase n=1 Tax=Devosia algicola TaxID=3026418 RepID=A0ABY7YRX8_9HYPH|nr:N-acetyltransferase [Devosia algicola]WDR04101.1 N-acetyltransferase [Devosia algicola]
MIVPDAASAVAESHIVPNSLIVRPVDADDEAFVEDLQALAFGPGRFSRTAFRVREQFPIDPSLSMIAEVNGTRCGSVWMTPISVGGVNGYLLGPLATHPDFRKRGAGKLLAREVSARALARGQGRFVLLVGDQDYYCPLGWETTTQGAIQFPGPVDPTRVLLLSPETGLSKSLSGPIASYQAD